MNKQQIELVPSKNYETVVQVNIPIRFYFTEGNHFDGIEVGVFKREPNTKDLIALNRLLEFFEKVIVHE